MRRFLVVLAFGLSACRGLSVLLPDPTDPPIAVEPTPAPTPTPAPDPTPDPEPTPDPLPDPEPTPPPLDPRWAEATGSEECPAGGPSAYTVEVNGALRRALDAGDITDPWPGTEQELYTAMLPFLGHHGLYSAMLHEELAVQRPGVGPFSENYDLLRADGRLRTGGGVYRSTCTPALRTAPLIVKGPLPPIVKYPAPVTRIDVKIHSWPAPSRAVMDGTAKSCGPNPDFPDRQCWPSCGVEGAHPEGCDASLEPRWEGSPGIHKENPWQLHVAPGARVRVCVGSVCSAWVVAQ